MKYKLSKLSILKAIIWRSLIFVALQVLFIFFVEKYGLYKGVDIIESLIWGVYVFLGIISPILEYTFWSYFIFDDIIEIKYGILYKRFICIKIDKIKYINICEGPVETLLKLKSLHIYTAGGRVVIPSISIDQAIIFYNMVKRKS